MWTTPEEFRAKIGGNYYVDTPNIIVARGESIFKLKRRDSDGMLLIDFDLYDANGNKIATIRNGNIVKGHSGNFEFHKEPNRYWIVEKKTGRVICDIRKASKAEDGSEIEVSVDLYTKSGIHIVAGPDSTRMGNLVASGNTFRKCVAAIVVD